MDTRQKMSYNGNITELIRAERWLMKKILLTMGLLLLCLSCTGCMTRLELMQSWADRADEACARTIVDFTAALEARDAAALRALFSPKTRATYDLDGPVQTLLALTEGSTLRTAWDGHNRTGVRRSGGQRTEDASFHIDLYIDDTPYCVWFELTHVCTADAGSVGVSYILLASDYARCSKDFRFPEGDGLHIVAHTGRDYRTRRVQGQPYIWTEVERTVTEAELMAVVCEAPILAAVEAAFGKPNASDLCAVYQLADEAGEARYAILYTEPDGDLSSVSICNEAKWLRKVYDAQKQYEILP